MTHTNYKRYTFILFLVIKKNHSAVKSQSLNFIFSSCFPVLHPLQYLLFVPEKNRSKARESERDNFGRAFFNTAGQRYSPENNGTSYISLYGLGGLIGREVDNQDHGPSMKAVQQGLLAGAAPQGSSLSLSVSLSLGLWVSPHPLGTETVEPTSLRGPYRHQARNTRRGRFAEFRWSVPDTWPGSEASVFCAYFTCQTVCTCADMMRENNFNRGKNRNSAHA